MNIAKRAAALLLVLTLVLTASVSLAAGSPTLTPISDATVTVTNKSSVWDGSVKSATITVTLDGVTLKEGTDYTVTGNETPDSAAGTYKLRAKIKGVGKFTGKITKGYRYIIKKAPQKVTGTFDYKVKSGVTNRIKLHLKSSTRRAYTPSVTKGIRINKYGKVTISRKLAPGTYTVEIYAKESANHKKSKTKTVTIVLK